MGSWVNWYILSDAESYKAWVPGLLLCTMGMAISLKDKIVHPHNQPEGGSYCSCRMRTPGCIAIGGILPTFYVANDGPQRSWEESGSYPAGTDSLCRGDSHQRKRRFKDIVTDHVQADQARKRKGVHIPHPCVLFPVFSCNKGASGFGYKSLRDKQKIFKDYDYLITWKMIDGVHGWTNIA